MGVPVCLNVYDMAPQNNYLYWCGCGIFHTGVEVNGVEYAFGGHDYDYTGIFASNPRQAPGGVTFRETIPMGETHMSENDIHALVQSMGAEYKGNKYHLLQRNCNHFANDLCKRLTGLEAPFWVNRLAGLAVMLHCLLPTAWVPPLQGPSAFPDGFKEARQGLLVPGQRSDARGEQLSPSAFVGGNRI